MTMPTQHNCAHSDTGWCLDCVQALADDERAKRDTFRESINKEIERRNERAAGLKAVVRDCDINWYNAEQSFIAATDFVLDNLVESILGQRPAKSEFMEPRPLL